MMWSKMWYCVDLLDSSRCKKELIYCRMLYWINKIIV